MVLDAEAGLPLGEHRERLLDRSRLEHGCVGEATGIDWNEVGIRDERGRPRLRGRIIASEQEPLPARCPFAWRDPRSLLRISR